jgi:hypothetical protein
MERSGSVDDFPPTFVSYRSEYPREESYRCMMNNRTPNSVSPPDFLKIPCYRPVPRKGFSSHHDSSCHPGFYAGNHSANVPHYATQAAPSFDSTGSSHGGHYTPPPPPPPVLSNINPHSHSYPPPYHGGYQYYAPWPNTPPPEYVTDIQPEDVLSGRGGATNSHSGNRAFRTLVKDFQERYLKAKKRDKPSVASLVVELVRLKGGRFLRRMGTDSDGQVLWIDIGDERAREKTCQALREGAPLLRRSRHTPRSFDDVVDAKLHDSIKENDSFETPSSTVRTTPARNLGHGMVQSSIVRVVQDNENWMKGSIFSSSKDHDINDGPIVIRPMRRLLPRRSVAPIPLDQLSPQDRDLYLRDFLPPCPSIGKQSNIAAEPTASPSHHPVEYVEKPNPRATI